MSNAPRSMPGVFEVVGQSGVPAMTAVLMQNGKVTFLDKVENYTQIVLENGQYAYSAEYDPETNEIIAGLSVKVRILPSLLSMPADAPLDEPVLLWWHFSGRWPCHRRGRKRSSAARRCNSW